MDTLFSLSQAELIEMVLQVRAEVEELRVERELLQARVAELEEELRKRGGGKGTPLVVKSNHPRREPKARKPREQGFGRPRAVVPDERRAHALERCPDCGRRLEGGWEHSSRQVIEIELRTRVVEHVFLGRRCGICQKRWVPRAESVGLGVQGRRRFGASVQALVALLRMRGRIPVRTIQELLREGADLAISTGEIVGLLHGVRAAGAEEVEAIKARLRGAAAVHGDETGWRENGQNGYLWGFFTDTDRYFEFHQTRAGTVPEEILGKDFAGVCICDFYGGYNRLDRLQRCWVHLLRDADALAEQYPTRPDVQAWVEDLHQLYREAKDFSAQSVRRRRGARRAFEARAEALARPFAQDPEAAQRVLSQRILKHLGELFVFVEYPYVASQNNLAERSLRPAVIARKISGGTRSEEGSKTQTGLLSLFSTWRAQGQPLLKNCEELLLPTPAP